MLILVKTMSGRAYGRRVGQPNIISDGGLAA